MCVKAKKVKTNSFSPHTSTRATVKCIYRSYREKKNNIRCSKQPRYNDYNDDDDDDDNSEKRLRIRVKILYNLYAMECTRNSRENQS